MNVTACIDDAMPANVRRRIVAIDAAVKVSSADCSLLAQADQLLALRLAWLGAPALSGLPTPASTSPAHDMVMGYQLLRMRIATLLDENALGPEQLTALIRNACADLNARDWWHVYRYAIYCLFLIIERFGQEIGWPRGEASRSLFINLGQGDPMDLKSYLNLTFGGRLAHTLSSFVFLGTPVLELSVGQELIAYDHQGRRIERPHNPFEVTGDGETRRGPTACDVTPFSNLLVRGELVGYEVNRRLLSVMAQVAASHEPCSLAMSIKSIFRQLPHFLEQARRDYQAFNRSPFSPAEFAYVLRQFTVDLGSPPSKLWEALRDGEPLGTPVAALLDHFTFRMNQPRLDPRLLASLAQDIEGMLDNAVDPAVRDAAHRAIVLLRANQPEPQRLGEALVELAARDAGLSLRDGEACDLTRHIVANDHEYVPSGSTSMVYAVFDVFFGVDRATPTYISHLLNRRMCMPEIDQHFLDMLLELQQALPEGADSWSDHLRTLYAGDAEMQELLDAIGNGHAAVTSAHAGVLARFVYRPGRRSPEQFGGTSMLISSLETGTTGMHFGPLGLLMALRVARQRLLVRPCEGHQVR